jgi:hypothetical protein
VKILHGIRVKNFREAAELAFGEAGADDLSLSVADLFESADAAKLRSEAKGILSLRSEGSIGVIPPGTESGGASPFQSPATIAGAVHKSPLTLRDTS